MHVSYSILISIKKTLINSNTPQEFFSYHIKMERVIFQLRFWRKIFFTPATNGKIDLHSSEFNADLDGMDANEFQNRRDGLLTSQKFILVGSCILEVQWALIPMTQSDAAVYQHVRDDQMNIMMELMKTFLLVHCRPCEDAFVQRHRNRFIGVLLQVCVVLLQSNKKAECKAWVKQHLPEMKTFRTKEGDSILHLAMLIDVGCCQKEPLMRLLIEHGRIDVNVQDDSKRTPLHLLSMHTRRLDRPTEDMIQVAEVLIDNGAHMDLLDSSGREAASGFSGKFPRWSFNFNLKCLAARAIIKHGVEYESVAPKELIPFIQSHKSERKQCNQTSLQGWLSYLLNPIYYLLRITYYRF